MKESVLWFRLWLSYNYYRYVAVGDVEILILNGRNFISEFSSNLHSQINSNLYSYVMPRQLQQKIQHLKNSNVRNLMQYVNEFHCTRSTTKWKKCKYFNLFQTILKEFACTMPRYTLIGLFFSTLIIAVRLLRHSLYFRCK